MARRHVNGLRQYFSWLVGVYRAELTAESHTSVFSSWFHYCATVKPVWLSHISKERRPHKT